MASPQVLRAAARQVLGGDRSTIDTSGLAIPQVPLVASLVGGRFELVGSITYRCHTCGETIPRPWDVLFVDDTPGQEWASSLTPARTTPRTTTHHASHMAAD